MFRQRVSPTSARRRPVLPAVAVACLVVAGLSGFAAQDHSATNADAAVNAVATVAPEALSKLAPTTASSTIAAKATTKHLAASIPVDPKADLMSSANDVPRQHPASRPTTLRLGLPYAEKARKAAKSSRAGVVVFDNTNGSATVPVIHSDGTLQINTVISNKKAPTQYDYPVNVPEGGRMVVAPDNGVVILAANDVPIGAVTAPWAKDANGKKVPTHFEIHGTTLRQVVSFTAGTAFPVVADPSASTLWWGVAVKLTKTETRNLNNNFTPVYFTTIACGYAGPFAPVCALAASIRLWTWHKPVIDAAGSGRCAQLNMPWGTGVVLWNVTSEKC